MQRSHSVSLSLSLSREPALREMRKISPGLYDLVYRKVYQPVLFTVQIALYTPTKIAISNDRRLHEQS